MLGKRLKKLRIGKDMTQQQLADYLHVSPGSIGMWEHDRREPDIDMLVKLADFYQVTLDYLVGREIKITTDDTRKIVLNNIADTLEQLSEQIKNIIEE